MSEQIDIAVGMKREMREMGTDLITPRREAAKVRGSFCGGVGEGRGVKAFQDVGCVLPDLSVVVIQRFNKVRNSLSGICAKAPEAAYCCGADEGERTGHRAAYCGDCGRSNEGAQVEGIECQLRVVIIGHLGCQCGDGGGGVCSSNFEGTNGAGGTKNLVVPVEKRTKVRVLRYGKWEFIDQLADSRHCVESMVGVSEGPAEQQWDRVGGDAHDGSTGLPLSGGLGAGFDPLREGASVVAGASVAAVNKYDCYCKKHPAGCDQQDNPPSHPVQRSQEGSR